MKKSDNHIVPVFIPHLGCPHRCVFCNQNGISGALSAPSPEDVRNLLDKSLSSNTSNAAIAFYGGSFTGLAADAQDAYLEAAAEFVQRGFASGIRLSTRPDYMDIEMARRLCARGVVCVELGVQSMDDGVLKSSGRGHTAQDSVAAAGAVKNAGLTLGVQIMAGLPGDSREKFLDTVREVVSIGPDFVRIYPALVVDGAPLAALWRRGEYAPLPLDEAVGLCADAVRLFRETGIKVIRLGLQAGRELEAALLAGPYHPAFGHLVESEIAYRRMRVALAGHECKGAVKFLVNHRELSVYKGISSENIKKFLKEGLNITITADEGVQKGRLAVENE